VKIGAAVSPYQHFGFCVCDLPIEPGAQHFKYYELDLALASLAKLDIFRTGIDWGSIFPRPRTPDKRVAKLYIDYLSYAKSLGLDVWVTLHHFVNPPWFWKLGGWHRRGNYKLFLEYVEYVISNLGDYIDAVLLFNEPNVYVYETYIRGLLPPYCVACFKKASVASLEIRDAIINGRDLVKQYGKPTSFTIHYAYHIGTDLLSRLITEVINVDYLMWINIGKEMSFYSINIYAQPFYSRKFGRYYRFDFNQIISKVPKPLAITETGIAGSDNLKISYACELGNSLRSIEVLAVIWWSLVHGYEWGLGYGVDFSLIGVDIWHGFKRVIRRVLWLVPQAIRSGCTGGVHGVYIDWRTLFTV